MWLPQWSAIRHSVLYLEGSHDPDMMSEVVLRNKPSEQLHGDTFCGWVATTDGPFDSDAEESDRIIELHRTRIVELIFYQGTPLSD